MDGDLVSQRVLNYIADSIEHYTDLLEMSIIANDVSEEDFQKSIAKTRKMIKKLRKGKWEGILNPEQVSIYRDLLEQEAEHAAHGEIY